MEYLKKWYLGLFGFFLMVLDFLGFLAEIDVPQVLPGSGIITGFRGSLAKTLQKIRITRLFKVLFVNFLLSETNRKNLTALFIGVSFVSFFIQLLTLNANEIVT